MKLKDGIPRGKMKRWLVKEVGVRLFLWWGQSVIMGWVAADIEGDLASGQLLKGRWGGRFCRLVHLSYISDRSVCNFHKLLKILRIFRSKYPPLLSRLVLLILIFVFVFYNKSKVRNTKAGHAGNKLPPLQLLGCSVLQLLTATYMYTHLPFLRWWFQCGVHTFAGIPYSNDTKYVSCQIPC